MIIIPRAAMLLTARDMHQRNLGDRRMLGSALLNGLLLEVATWFAAQVRSICLIQLLMHHHEI